MRILSSNDTAAVAALLDRSPTQDAELTRRVARIIAGVRKDGDRALLSYVRQFDHLVMPMEVTREEMRDAAAGLSPAVRSAIAAAAKNIRHIARRQVPKGWTTSPTPGITIEQRVMPLDRVGCYVPAGRYPLPSSLLMAAIPAKVAGVPEIIAVCPRPDVTVMAAARGAGGAGLPPPGGRPPHAA